MTDEGADGLAAGEAAQGPAGDVEALAAAISAHLYAADGTPAGVRAVFVSEEALRRDFAAQGAAEFEGPDGPRSARNPHPQAVKAWLARACRAHRLSCAHDGRRQG